MRDTDDDTARFLPRVEVAPPVEVANEYASLYDLAMDAVDISNLALRVAERAGALHDALMDTWITEDEVEGVA